MKNFDFYEFAGILTPGVVVLFAVSLTYPQATPFLVSQQISVGSLGLFVVLAYVAGHLVQGIGNLLESSFWRLFGGMPTNWVVRQRTCGYLNIQQLEALPKKIEQHLGTSFGKALRDLADTEWTPTVRAIYACVQAAGRSGRADIFNGNYGMLRGVGCAFLLAAILFALSATDQKRALILVMIGCAVVAFARMHRFGKHYARELFIQFLQLEPRKEI
jgi:hypothetical protein